MKSPQQSAGFTLIELMVIMMVLAVMLTLAVPSFVSFQRNSELTSIANKLVGSINSARGEAMKVGRNALVTPNDASTWSSGWISFVDMNADNAYTEGTDILVQTQAAIVGYISITGNNNAAASPPYIGFDSSGFARTIGGNGVTNLTLTIKRNDITAAQEPEQSRLVIVARTGRVRACKPSGDTSCTTSAVN
ncbi:GspH/FimT family pseudopilin [Comamonas sp. Y33R10-2]|uniref:GspH/FimT family pseudopilin n=1 Tax=Comamonas sp. Y33R10-2 TaxID=2853257 RepID=UPI001C5CB881|nr:GspH/FimT family pseudopilin [Comamonas sp. Y33R10-2]QXZ10153.1 GspH/FimT family pseudopilin [Comamonas sp. Y33R10-2]